MKQLELSDLELSDLCRELSLLLHAGVGLADGLILLSEEEKERGAKEMLDGMARCVENGGQLSQAFSEAKCFPVYVVGLVGMGEQVGRTEETLAALARYYEDREQLARRVRSSLTYPAVLLCVMMAVIVVLLTKVLPVFDDIYASLGGSLTGLAGGLLLLGGILDAAMPVLLAVLAGCGLAGAAAALHPGLRGTVLNFFRRRWGDKGVFRKLNDARFAQALSLGMSSGMPFEDAVDMAAKLLDDVPSAQKRCQACWELLARGESLSKALGDSGMMPASACRLLTLGMRSGSGDQVMEDIARRLSEDAQQALEQQAAKVEPALVLVTSVLVGAILLSVMLPLMNIMAAIG